MKKKTEFFKAIFQNIYAYDAACACAFMRREKERGREKRGLLLRSIDGEREGDDEVEAKMGFNFCLYKIWRCEIVCIQLYIHTETHGVSFFPFSLYYTFSL